MYVTVGRPWLLQHTTTKKGKTVYNFTLDKKVSIIIIIIIIYVIITGACMARYTQLYVCLRRELNKMEIEKKTNEKFAWTYTIYIYYIIADVFSALLC